MIGRISYNTTLASTPAMSPFAAVDMFALADVFQESLPVGSAQDVVLRWGYMNLDPAHNDIRNLSQSASGVVEVTHFLSTDSFKFTVPKVPQTRIGGSVNEYAVLNALSDECAKGTPLTWWPEFDNYPTEYISCVANGRLDQKRIGVMKLWNFSFDLLQLASVQIPSTIPPFVLS
jgi:hypothetical protein